MPSWSSQPHATVRMRPIRSASTPARAASAALTPWRPTQTRGRSAASRPASRAFHNSRSSVAVPSVNRPSGTRKRARAPQPMSGWAVARPGVKGTSRTPAHTRATDTSPGSAAQANTVVREAPQPCSSTRAISGPAKAPAWSIARWSPNAAARRSGSIDAASSASRGAPRSPLPTRSVARTSPTCQGALANASSGRDTAPSP